ncbi:hypothetical protein PVAP13_8NG330300 [Panicum virgatum]|uniref:Uncharacterized protein n=1 Tax=Panicum virgatum TaxID=38727 RepID=A0A8T0PFE1_PANVG|nr:hypothetical protein PVAP13_8NG330300 [Panicum virgatum]
MAQTSPAKARTKGQRAVRSRRSSPLRRRRLAFAPPTSCLDRRRVPLGAPPTASGLPPPARGRAPPLAAPSASAPFGLAPAAPCWMPPPPARCLRVPATVGMCCCCGSASTAAVAGGRHRRWPKASSSLGPRTNVVRRCGGPSWRSAIRLPLRCARHAPVRRPRAGHRRVLPFLALHRPCGGGMGTEDTAGASAAAAVDGRCTSAEGPGLSVVLVEFSLIPVSAFAQCRTKCMITCCK